MLIDWKKIVTNLFNTEMTVEEISKRSHTPEDKLNRLNSDEDVELKHVEAKMLMRLHFRECGDLHNDIFVG